MMKVLKLVIKQMMPLIFPYVFIGIAFGILLKEAGYSAFWAFISAVFVYAGSMQIVMVSFMTGGVSLIIVALMTFFINGRHLFYGISFVDEFRNKGNQKYSFWKYFYMALTITDETYSILCSMNSTNEIVYPEGYEKHTIQFYILFFSHMIWVVSCTIGSLIGNILPFDMNGIEFSAVAFFTAVVINQWISFKSHIPAITGLLSSIALYFILGPDRFILPALSVSMIVLVILRDRIIQKKETSAV